MLVTPFILAFVVIVYLIHKYNHQIPQYRKNVIITGASAGIGRQLAITYAMERKARHLVLCARNLDKLEELKKEIENLQESVDEKTKITILQIDVSIKEDCKRLIDESIKVMKTIDILVLNAGATSIVRFSKAEENDLQNYRQVMETNYWSCVNTTFYALPHMKRQKFGHICVISSMAGITGFLLRTGYSPTKFALYGFFDSLRLETHDEGFKGINFSIVHPGPVISSIHDKWSGTVKRNLNLFMKTDVCANHIIRAIELNRFEYLMPMNGYILFKLKNFMPTWVFDYLRNRSMKSVMPEQ
jgi:short-subunit dehydrogenase